MNLHIVDKVISPCYLKELLQILNCCKIALYNVTVLRKFNSLFNLKGF